MQNRKSFIVLLLILMNGCASVNTPRKWLLEPDEVPSDPYGTWIETEYFNNDNIPVKTRGELIALDKDSLYLLNDYFETLPVLNIKSARLVKYNSGYGELGTWAFLGSISTCSNGWFLVFTFPIWLIGGSISTSIRSYEPVMDYPKHILAEFVPFARFPQGLPADLKRNELYPKGFIKPVIAEKDSNKTSN